MDIKHLITFKTIAQLGSFTKASQVLNYSQSTLTIHIQTIEKELDGRVFDRIGRHIAITTLGNELLPLAAAIITNYEKIETLKRPHDRGNQTITLGMQESVALYRLQPLIRRFQQRYPQVTLIQVLGHKSELTEKLLASELDAMFVMQRRDEQAQLPAVELVEEKMGIVGNHSALHSLTDLASETTVFIYPKNDCSYRNIFDKYLGGYVTKQTNLIEALSIEAIKNNILLHHGVSVLPYSTVASEIASRQLRFFELDLAEKDKISTQFLYHKKKWLSPLLHEFTFFVEKELRS